MNSEMLVTLAAALAAGALFAYASWRANLPPNPNKPRMLPWHAIIVMSALALILACVHGVNLMGVETGALTARPG